MTLDYDKIFKIFSCDLINDQGFVFRICTPKSHRLKGVNHKEEGFEYFPQCLASSEI